MDVNRKTRQSDAGTRESGKCKENVILQKKPAEGAVSFQSFKLISSLFCLKI